MGYIMWVCIIKLGSYFLNASIKLKFDRNYLNSIQTRTTFIEIFQGQWSVNLGSDFQKCADWTQFDRNNPDNILNRLNLLSRSSKFKGQPRVFFKMLQLGSNLITISDTLNILDQTYVIVIHGQRSTLGQISQ